MPILNYTTDVPVDRTLAAITKLLVRAGARSISTNYDVDGVPTGVVFHAPTPLGPRVFSLPVNALKVEAVLRKQKVERRYQGAKHAERVAWRILKDWLEAQLAVIEAEMVSLDEVMLPYMWASVEDERTVYQLYVENSLPALPAGE